MQLFVKMLSGHTLTITIANDNLKVTGGEFIAQITDVINSNDQHKEHWNQTSQAILEKNTPNTTPACHKDMEVVFAGKRFLRQQIVDLEYLMREDGIHLIRRNLTQPPKLDPTKDSVTSLFGITYLQDGDSTLPERFKSLHFAQTAQDAKDSFKVRASIAADKRTVATSLIVMKKTSVDYLSRHGCIKNADDNYQINSNTIKQFILSPEQKANEPKEDYEHRVKEIVQGYETRSTTISAISMVAVLDLPAYSEGPNSSTRMVYHNNRVSAYGIPDFVKNVHELYCAMSIINVEFPEGNPGSPLSLAVQPSLSVLDNILLNEIAIQEFQNEDDRAKTQASIEQLEQFKKFVTDAIIMPDEVKAPTQSAKNTALDERLAYFFHQYIRDCYHNKLDEKIKNHVIKLIDQSLCNFRAGLTNDANPATVATLPQPTLPSAPPASQKPQGPIVASAPPASEKPNDGTTHPLTPKLSSLKSIPASASSAFSVPPLSAKRKMNVLDSRIAPAAAAIAVPPPTYSSTAASNPAIAPPINPFAAILNLTFSTQISDDRKTNKFLRELYNLLFARPNNETLTKQDIYNFFLIIKEKSANNPCNYIHTQKHPKLDYYRSFFKQKRRDGESFWHTKSYDIAISWLKRAFLAAPTGGITPHKEDELIDYVRGNFLDTKLTKTQEFKKKNTENLNL